MLQEKCSEKNQFDIQLTSLMDKLQYLNAAVAQKTETILKLEAEKVALEDNLKKAVEACHQTSEQVKVRV